MLYILFIDSIVLCSSYLWTVCFATDSV